MDSLTRELLCLVKKTGNILLTYYQNSKDYQLKSDHSPVTEADLAADRTLRIGLQHLSLRAPVLSEESTDKLNRSQLAPSRYWLIDPLDGTRDFMAGTGDFTINIALMEQDQPLLGMIYVPVRELAYFAIRSVGAFKQQYQEAPQLISTRSWDLASPLQVVTSRYHATTSLLPQFFQRLRDGSTINLDNRPVATWSCTSYGSALKFGLIAEGSADLYPRFSTTSIWDTAAGQCIVEAAGGQVLDRSGHRLCYPLKGSLQNPEFLVAGDPIYPWSDPLQRFFSN